MPYTDDPENIPADAVRFLVGDTDVARPQLSDSQVSFLLSEENDNVRRAAARAAETLAAHFAKLARRKRVGPLEISYENTAADYSKLATLLWSRAHKSGAGPYAGGLSEAEKATGLLDSDLVRGTFRRRMMRYPYGNRVQSSPQEILSPPEVIP